MKKSLTVRSSDPFHLIQTELGPYLIQSFLARGATSAIYLALHKKQQKMYALKVFPFSPFRSDFLHKEAEIMLALQHPYIVQMHEYLLSQGWFCIAMEWLSGGNLRKVLRKKKVLSLQEWARIFLPILSALSYAHKNGILHLDLKPENILFTSTGQPKLVDFGTSALLTGDIYPTDYIVGTPEYLSPEQINGGALSPRTDIYQVGVLSYECLTGKTPFQGSLTEILHAHCFQPVERVNTLPPRVSAILLRLLEKNPEFRPFSVDEVIEDILELVFPAELKENPELEPYFLQSSEKIRKRNLMKEEEKFWLSSAGNCFRTQRFPFPFPSTLLIEQVPMKIPKTYLHCPPIFSPRSQRIFILTTQGSLLIASFQNGFYEVRIPHPVARGFSLSPEEFCFIPTLGGGIFLLSPDGEILQQFLPGKWCSSSPLFWKNRLFVGCYDSNFYILEPFIGKEVARVACQGSILIPATVTPLENVVFGALDGVIYGVSRNGEILWKRALDAPLASSPVASESGKLFSVTQKGTLYCLNQGDGEILWYMEKQVESVLCLSPSGDPLVSLKTGEIVYLSSSGGIRWLFLPLSMPAFSPISDINGSFFLPLQNQSLLYGKFDEHSFDYFSLPFPVFSFLPAGSRELLAVSSDGNWVKITEAPAGEDTPKIQKINKEIREKCRDEV
ncbi:MAG: protein kinase domain-containing protein [bacterium JZ-2024 1]